MPFVAMDDWPRGTARNCCYLCGSDLRGEPCFDTGLIVEFEGRLAFCSPCMREAGRAVGMVAPERAEEMAAELATAIAAADQAREESADLRAALDALLRVGYQPPAAAPFVTCGECGRTFKSSLGLAQHQGREHKPEPTVKEPTS